MASDVFDMDMYIVWRFIATVWLRSRYCSMIDLMSSDGNHGATFICFKFRHFRCIQPKFVENTYPWRGPNPSARRKSRLEDLSRAVLSCSGGGESTEQRRKDGCDQTIPLEQAHVVCRTLSLVGGSMISWLRMRRHRHI